MADPSLSSSTLAPSLLAMAGEAVRTQALLDAGWLADRAQAAVQAPGEHPLAQALRERILPPRQLLTRFEFTLNCELALTGGREASILVRPLGLGYLASAAETTTTACRLTLVIAQTPAVPAPLSEPASTQIQSRS